MSPSHSDELEALEACTKADIERNTKKGIVICRAWTLGEAFRSEEDHSVGISASDGRGSKC